MEQTILYENWLDYVKALGKKSRGIMIYSPTTIELALGQETPDIDGMACVSSHVPFDRLSVVLTKDLMPFEYCIGIGGGAAIDRAKYLANLLKVPCIAIPSILSTNVFATNKVAYIDCYHNKTTIDSVLPDTIVYDDNLLKYHDIHSIYGLADAVSILTALKDWNIADRDTAEPISTEHYCKAIRILNEAKRIIDIGKFENIDIFSLLLRAGYITNEYGSGRPESGSEHILAKIVERKIDIPHAVAVSFSMLIVSQFHNCFEEVADIVEKLGIFPAILDIPSWVLRDSIIELAPRVDRYSIIDTLNKDALSTKQADVYLNRMYKRFNVCFNSIIFDLDGVLWDAVEKVSQTYQKCLKNKNIDLRSYMGKTSEQIADELGISLSTLESVQDEEVKSLWYQPGKIYSNVISTLKELKASGRDLFIVSNCQRGYINTFLEAYHLSGLFTDWRYDSTSEDFFVSSFSANPKADNIADLKNKYHMIYPVYVGDTEGDYKSATEAGVDFIAADYGFGTINRDVELRIDDISELPKLLEEEYEHTTR